MIGALRQMELYLNRPLQWLICQLHTNDNELPFCHLFQKLDRKTAGPLAFCEPIGKQLIFKEIYCL